MSVLAFDTHSATSVASDYPGHTVLCELTEKRTKG